MPVRVAQQPAPASVPKQTKAMPGSVRTISRRPAALVGIGLSVLVLFAMFRPDNGTLTKGQAQNDYKIVLTPDGPIPDKIVAAPGDQIEFLNLFQDPQSIDISQIPTIEGISVTPAIPFQSSFITTIDPSADRGEYAYQGVDSELIVGSVSVEFFTDENMQYPDEENTDTPAEEDTPHDAAPDEQTGDEISSEPSFEDLYPYDPSIFPTEGNGDNVFDLPNADPLPSDEQPAPTSYPAQVLPQNPFTVQYGQMQGTPLPPPYEGFTPQPEQHAGAPLNDLPSRPMHQPSTGAGEWLVVFLSVGALIVVTRKAFRRI